MKYLRAVKHILAFSLPALAVGAGTAAAQTDGQPAFAELRQFSSPCGHVATAKDNGRDRAVIVIGEYHQFEDVQADVECLLKNLVATYPGLQFLGKEGLGYDGGALYRSGRPKLNLGLPLIGIEAASYRNGYNRIRDIDDRHKALSRKKMATGLTPGEYVDYQHVSSLSYEIILRERSWAWIDNVGDHMDRTGATFGLLNTGFGHFPTMAERLDHHGISYIFLIPNAADNYCVCEAYWQKRKPDPARSCKAVCEDPAIVPVWD